MSLADLLPAIRSLSKPEQVELLHLLIDGVAKSSSADTDIPEALLGFVPPPGTLVPVHTPAVTDAVGMSVLNELLSADGGRG